MEIRSSYGLLKTWILNKNDFGQINSFRGHADYTEWQIAIVHS
jgi:hypothetical protein